MDDLTKRSTGKFSLPNVRNNEALNNIVAFVDHFNLVVPKHEQGREVPNVRDWLSRRVLEVDVEHLALKTAGFRIGLSKFPDAHSDSRSRCEMVRKVASENTEKALF